MKLTFSTQGWDDYLYWQVTDKAVLKRINLLIKEVMREPFSGIGKPEPLKHGLAGYCADGSEEEGSRAKRADRLGERRYPFAGIPSKPDLMLIFAFFFKLTDR